MGEIDSERSKEEEEEEKEEVEVMKDGGMELREE